MEKAALIVVDMQNDFISGTLSLKECPANQDGETIIGKINDLTSNLNWDLIIYTKDWHPNDHISFVTNAYRFEQHEDSQVETSAAEVYDTVVFNVDGCKRREQLMWPPHCIQNTWGSEFHKELLIAKGSHTVTKGLNKDVDSYSAFFDNNRLQETELRELLQRHGITHTFICGVATDVCVNYTAMDSFEIGFKTNLVEDACQGVNTDNITSSIKKMKATGIHIIQSEQVGAELISLKSEKKGESSVNQSKDLSCPQSC